MTTRKECTAFTIDRSKWARRGLNGMSAMLNNQGAMCCLGFYAKACGATDEELLGKSNPDQVRRIGSEPGGIAEWLMGDGTNSFFPHASDANELMNANDGTGGFCYGFGQDKLETLIIDTFARHGVAVNFVDGEQATVAA